jgi:outer membrane usher protein
MLMLLCGLALSDAPSIDEAMLLEARVNQVPRGDVMVIPIPPDGLWLRESELPRLGIRLHGLPRRIIGDTAFVRVTAGPDLSVKTDLDALSVDFHADPRLLAEQRFSLASAETLAPTAEAGLHGFFNYQLGQQTGTGQKPVRSLDTVANLSFAGWVARSEQGLLSSRSKSYQRGRSFLMFDEPDSTRRWMLGDTLTFSGAFARTIPIAGISVAQRFELQPGSVPAPTLAMRGNVRVPSTAEVYIDGARVRTLNLAPGPYEFRDLSYFAGLRDVEIVIRNRSGETERIRVPHYFSTQNVGAGIHEYDYALGVARQSSDQGDRYANVAASLWHRVGVSDSLTLGASVEHLPGYRSLGANAVQVLGLLGVTTVNVVRAEAAGQRGNAMLLTYSFGGRATVQTSFLRQSRGFAVGDTRSLLDFRPRDLWSMSAGTSLGHARTVTVDVARGRTWDGPSNQSVGVRLAQGLGGGASIGIALSSRQDGAMRDRQISMTLALPLARDFSLNSGVDFRQAEGSSKTVSIASPVPAGEGAAIRVGAEWRNSGASYDAFGQYNHRLAQATLAMRQMQSADGLSSFGSDLRLTGAFAFADGRVQVAPSIVGSFGWVDTQGLAAVRVYQNNQLIGRTNHAGHLLLPNLASYSTNQIRIDDRDIPLDRELERFEARVVPRTFQGSVIRFAAKRVSAVGGVLVVTPSVPRKVLASAVLGLQVGDRLLTATSGPDGDFYLEDLPPGTYRLAAENRAYNCVAEIVVLPDKGAFQDIGEVACVANR